MVDELIPGNHRGQSRDNSTYGQGGSTSRSCMHIGSRVAKIRHTSDNTKNSRLAQAYLSSVAASPIIVRVIDNMPPAKVLSSSASRSSAKLPPSAALPSPRGCESSSGASGSLPGETLRSSLSWRGENLWKEGREGSLTPCVENFEAWLLFFP